MLGTYIQRKKAKKCSQRPFSLTGRRKTLQMRSHLGETFAQDSMNSIKNADLHCHF